jgi:predicted phosphodiesterase
MPATKTSKREVAEKLCERFPDANNLSLARRLYKEHPGQFTSLETARTMIRHVRGVKGEARRKNATHPKAPGKAGQLLAMPPSVAKPWVPFTVENPGRVGIISDLHVPYHSEQAIESAINQLQQDKIDTLLINGDLADWYECSRWEKNPHNRIGFKAEMEAVKQCLAFLRQQFKGVRIIYKAGNHEERWNKFIWNKAPELWDLPALQMNQLLGLEALDIEWVDDQRIIMLGELPILHGHELPKGISSPVNAARGAYMRTKHTVLVGHSHQTSGHCEPNLFHSECFVWSTGCLCDMTPEYARINRWNWGFARADVAKSGSFNVHNYRISKEGEVRTS